MLWPEESKESALALVHLRQLYNYRAQTLLARYSYGAEDLLYRIHLGQYPAFIQSGSTAQIPEKTVLPLCCDVKPDRMVLSAFCTRIFG